MIPTEYRKPCIFTPRIKVPPRCKLAFLVPGYLTAPVGLLLEDDDCNLYHLINVWPRNWHQLTFKERIAICENCHDPD